MSELSRAYAVRPDRGNAPPVSQVERAALCDLFDRLGPTASTLIPDWTCHHLAAHLSLRSGSPVHTVRVARSPGGLDAGVEAIVHSVDFTELVDQLRRPAPRSPLSWPLLEKLLNTLEYFVHHEDVRRAQPGWTPRPLPLWAQNQLWRRLTGYARLALRRAPVGVQLVRTDTAESTIETRRRERDQSGRQVMVYGNPAELALFTFRRPGVGRVRLAGAPDDLEALRAARFSD